MAPQVRSKSAYRGSVLHTDDSSPRSFQSNEPRKRHFFQRKKRTSTIRRFATISSGSGLFLGRSVPPLLSEDMHQGGPIQWVWITGASGKSGAAHSSTGAHLIEGPGPAGEELALINPDHLPAPETGASAGDRPRCKTTRLVSLADYRDRTAAYRDKTAGHRDGKALNSALSPSARSV
jgi:hypothetical protein